MGKVVKLDVVWNQSQEKIKIKMMNKVLILFSGGNNKMSLVKWVQFLKCYSEIQSDQREKVLEREKMVNGRYQHIVSKLYYILLMLCHVTTRKRNLFFR